LLYALIAVVAKTSHRFPASSVGCVRVTVEAVVADGQNSRVAPWFSEDTPERRVCAWLGALVQVYNPENFATPFFFFIQCIKPNRFSI
jgi:hypothetical protein